MGHYAHCWLDDIYVGGSKNDIDIEIISLFRPKDKIITSSPTGILKKHCEYYEDSIEDDPELKVVYYESSVEVVRDRLNILGYDLITAKEAFRSWISEELNYVQKRLEEEKNRKSPYSELFRKHREREVEILSNLSPENWIENLKTINESGIKTNYYGRYEGPHEDTAIGYMLSNDWYGYPGYDKFVPLRLAIEAFDTSQRILYDVTDLVWAGYFDYDDDLVQYGIDISESEFISKSKTIVLTEGETDAWILSEVFNLLYPHLIDYYSFLDFESTGFGGGVGNLANVVKAFAGAGIVNNIIALFDNDTAAISACECFKKIVLPSNIVIQFLPNLDLLKSYPTIGPSGLVELNVNSMAASIELYLGEDVLRNNDGNLVPIQWTGYDKLVEQYQGEVLDKKMLYSRFKHKLNLSKNGEDVDWDDLDKIYKLIFNSFTKKNRRIICKRASEYYSE